MVDDRGDSLLVRLKMSGSSLSLFLYMVDNRGGECGGGGGNECGGGGECGSLSHPRNMWRRQPSSFR